MFVNLSLPLWRSQYIAHLLRLLLSVTILGTSFELFAHDHPKDLLTRPAYQVAIKELQSICTEVLLANIPTSALKLYTYAKFGDFENDTPPHDGPKIVSKRGRQIPTFYRITPENISLVFSHYKVNSQGEKIYLAKAVAVSMLGAEPTIYFFPTGNKDKTFNIHHRDALAVALESEKKRMEASHEITLDSLEEESTSLSTEHLVEATFVAESTLFNLLLPESAPGIVRQRTPIIDSKTSHKMRNILERAQGFQLQAREVDQRLEVIGIDIDSGITSRQLSTNMYLSQKYQLWLLTKTILRMSPLLRAFKIPKFPEGINWLENYPNLGNDLFHVRGGAYSAPSIMPSFYRE